MENFKMKKFSTKKLLVTIILLFSFSTVFGSKKKKVIFFIGPPTSGKTTAAKWCAKNKNWEYISTEHLCLDHVKNRTKIGKKIAPIVDAGKLVSDDIILQMIEEELKLAFFKTNNIILESFPRTTNQAKALEKLLKNKFDDPKFIVIRFCASDKTIIDRIQNRFVCTSCKKSYITTPNSPLVPKKNMTCDKCETTLSRKSDDQKKPIQKRIKTFRLYEQPLLDFYNKTNKNIFEFTIELDKNNPLEKQFQQISNLIEKE